MAEEFLVQNPEIKKEFDDKIKNDEAFAKNPRAQLNFIYKKSPHYEPAQKVKIKSETDDKIYLYKHVVNTETGDAYMIVGKKAPKGSKIKKQHARHFQIVKLNISHYMYL